MNTLKNCSDDELYKMQHVFKTIDTTINTVAISDEAKSSLFDLRKSMLKLSNQVEKELSARDYAMSKRISAKHSK